MKKIDPTVRKETGYILGFSLILSALMQSVLLIAGFWAPSVLWGNLLGLFAAVFNFFLLGLTVQNALGKEEKEARDRMKFSQMARMFFLILVALMGYLLSVFHLLAVVIPFLFPRIAIAFRPLFDRK